MMPGIIVALTILNITHVFQILNFIKYRNIKNGANETRIIFFLALVSFQIHLWRLHLGYAQGYFFLGGLCLLLWLFLKGYVFK